VHDAAACQGAGVAAYAALHARRGQDLHGKLLLTWIKFSDTDDTENCYEGS
jgi:hypothetical protein